MSLTAFPTLLRKLKSKSFRATYVSATVSHLISMQIRSLRNRRGWSQQELGAAANKPQNVISRLEDPSYGKVTIQTLLDLARAFDVGLLVRFVPFGGLAAATHEVSTIALAVPSFNDELESIETTPVGQSHDVAAANPSDVERTSSAASAWISADRPRQSNQPRASALGKRQRGSAAQECYA